MKKNTGKKQRNHLGQGLASTGLAFLAVCITALVCGSMKAPDGSGFGISVKAAIFEEEGEIGPGAAEVVTPEGQGAPAGGAAEAEADNGGSKTEAPAAGSSGKTGAGTTKTSKQNKQTGNEGTSDRKSETDKAGATDLKPETDHTGASNLKAKTGKENVSNQKIETNKESAGGKTEFALPDTKEQQSRQPAGKANEAARKEQQRNATDTAFEREGNPDKDTLIESKDEEQTGAITGQAADDIKDAEQIAAENESINIQGSGKKRTISSGPLVIAGLFALAAGIVRALKKT